VAWLVLGTVAVATTWTALAWEGRFTGALAFWFLASLLSEFLWIRLPMGKATLSMASCAHFAALLLLPGGPAMAVVALSSAVAEAAVLRKPAIRVMFNSAQSAIAVGAASLVLTAFGSGADAVRNLALGQAALPLLLAALTYFLVNSGAVSVAVAVAERTSPLAAWLRNFGNRYELLSSATLFSLGALLASHYLQAGPGGTFLVVCPIVLAHQGYRLHSLQRRAAPTVSAGARQSVRPPSAAQDDDALQDRSA
jgi:hypothetical protein